MPNLWRAFEQLLPKSPLLIGKVAVLHSDDTVTVILLDGGMLRVRGNPAYVLQPDMNVFIKDGQVQGDAPNLPQVDIEI